MMRDEEEKGHKPSSLHPWAPPQLAWLMMPRLRQRPSSSDATSHRQTNGYTDVDSPPLQAYDDP